MDSSKARVFLPHSVTFILSLLTLPHLAWAPLDPGSAPGWAWWGTRVGVLCFLLLLPRPSPNYDFRSSVLKVGSNPRTGSITIPLDLFLEMQILRPFSRPPESDTLGEAAAVCDLTSTQGILMPTKT